MPNLKKYTFSNCSHSNFFYHSHIQPIIDYASTLWSSAGTNTLKPLASIHKRAVKLTLLKSTSLAAHGYKVLDVLPLKLKLEFNKDTIMRKSNWLCTLNSKIQLHSIQNRYSHKLIVPRPRLYLFKCSFMYSGGNLWNNLPLRIKILTEDKAFQQNLMRKLTTKIN